MRGLGIVGTGALAHEIGRALRDGKAPGWRVVAVIGHGGGLDGASTVGGPGEMVAAGAEAVVEAAGVSAVAEHVPGLLSFGLDVIVLSTGAFGNPDVRGPLEQAAARPGAGCLVLPSGAIAGIDGIRAAKLSGQLDEVVLTTTKPAAAITGADAVEDMLFDGPASEAVVRYPKNINVAATVALAGVGFERTRVVLRVDPSLTRAPPPRGSRRVRPARVAVRERTGDREPGLVTTGRTVGGRRDQQARRRSSSRRLRADHPSTRGGEREPWPRTCTSSSSKWNGRHPTTSCASASR
jgi:aspartate dehydrogenase